MGSHWHLDQIGYAGEGGIWSLLEEQGITADVLIDRDGGIWNDVNGDEECDPDTEIEWQNAGTTSGTMRKWVCWATDPNSRAGQIRELAQLGSSNQIDLGLERGVTVTIVQVDADGVMMQDGITPVSGDHTAEVLPPSENDFAITIWLQWGKFDYVTGGDTSGVYKTVTSDYVYNDVETIVAERINQAVDVIKVNYHGSSTSTNANYLNTLNPDVAVYSLGANNYGYPDQEVLDRLNANGTKQYFTQKGNSNRNYSDSIIVNGNVEIIVTEGLTYTVAGDEYVATDPALKPNFTSTPTLEPTIILSPTPDELPSLITDDYGVPMALVPAGSFQMGTDLNLAVSECEKTRNGCQNSWFEDEAFVHTVYLSDFYIDLYEVSNAQYAQCVDSNTCTLPQKSSETRDSYYGNTMFLDYPVIFVSWYQAQEYCQWRGSRLPTEAEWEKSARGGLSDMPYPWGEQTPDCNMGNFVVGDSRCVGDTSQVGSYAPYGSYGLYDMAGNVSEWVADWYQSDYYKVSLINNPSGPEDGEMRVHRGGPWSYTYWRSRVTQRFRADPNLQFPLIGFRCARSP
jgi:formylglycine-generating enzyme required for sulfatase activity